MVEVFAVASGKGGTGKTTSTLALGMALAADHDVTVVDADTGMANLLFHAGLSDADPTLHDLLIGDATEARAADADADASQDADGRAGGTGAGAGTGTGESDGSRSGGPAVEDAVYERFGLSVVPCGTSLAAFEAADPARLRQVVADLAADTDVILLDSPAALTSKSAVLPVVLADRVVVVLQPTIPSLSDGLKVEEYARSYGTGTAGVLFNKVRADVGEVAAKTEEYFSGPVLGTVPDSDAARDARAAGEPLLAHAPEDPAAAAFREAAAALTVRDHATDAVADRFRSAVVPESP